MRTTLNADMSGKVAIVTGATSGIGREIARGLVSMKATVLIGARDLSRAETVRSDIGASGVLPLDVSDQASIRAFAAMVTENVGAVDVLINNAGAWFTDRRTSAQGVELTLATNVLGPFLLTDLLSESLQAANASRVVNLVSSIAGSYEPDDLQFTRRPYNGYQAYSQSKQALRMVTWAQSRRLSGTGTTANAVSPGFVRSELNRNAKGARAVMINLSARLFATSPTKGADTPLWAASDPELVRVTGKYLAGREVKDGGFDDQAAIDDLERTCRRLTQNPDPGMAEGQ